MRDRWPELVTILGIVALVVLALMAYRQRGAWKDWCHEQGGRVDESTHVNAVTTVSSNGGVGVGLSSDTTYFCLSADGKVLDVK
jgi:hypothetical protein